LKANMSRILEQAKWEQVRRRSAVATTVIKGGYVPLASSNRQASRAGFGSANQRHGAPPRDRPRTVAKANFRRAGSSNRAKLQHSLNYYQHRPDQSGERQSRPAFGRDGALETSEAREIINDAEGDYGYRLILSPGRDMNAEELEEWTQALMDDLEDDGVVTGWVGVAHDDQTDHPHSHVIALTSRRLEVDDFRALRLEGDIEAERVMNESWTARLESEFEAERSASSNSSGVQVEAEAGGAESKREPSLEDDELRW
jgi:hypothetical protein